MGIVNKTILPTGVVLDCINSIKNRKRRKLVIFLQKKRNVLGISWRRFVLTPQEFGIALRMQMTGPRGLGSHMEEPKEDWAAGWKVDAPVHIYCVYINSWVIHRCMYADVYWWTLEKTSKVLVPSHPAFPYPREYLSAIVFQVRGVGASYKMINRSRWWALLAPR